MYITYITILQYVHVCTASTAELKHFVIRRVSIIEFGCHEYKLALISIYTFAYNNIFADISLSHAVEHIHCQNWLCYIFISNNTSRAIQIYTCVIITLTATFICMMLKHRVTAEVMIKAISLMYSTEMSS